MERRIRTYVDIFLIALRLGLTSFGGPVAHLGYFHEEYVRRKKWLNEKSYADLVALCQFLPGPASSQVGIGVGIIRGGVVGGVLAFLGFTLPSVVVLTLFASFLVGMGIAESGWIHGLKIVAVVVVLHAILGMAQQLTPDRGRKLIALVALIAVLIWQTTFTQISVILLAGMIGYFVYKEKMEQSVKETFSDFPLSRRFAVGCLILFVGLLIILPIVRELTSIQWIAMFDSFYRSGSLVFGGGHVVLPLLEKEFVPYGWLSEEEFLAGYGATQAVPGPLFTFAAYIGAVVAGWKGALLATIAIFLPAILLIFGTLPFWNTLRHHPNMKGALMGVNAAVVGILIAAFYEPIWTSAIVGPIDFVIASFLFSMLVFWKWPPWSVVLSGIVLGALLI